MLQPQDLPGRYGRAIRAIDRVLAATGAHAVLAGGWAVWRHGYVGRVTQDVDVVVGADEVSELLRVASVSGFEVLEAPPGRWPKLHHKETGIDVDLLPEHATPGTSARPAPTPIPHPSHLGGEPGRLRYIDLPALVALKLAAGRARDDSDVVELILANRSERNAIRQYLSTLHVEYERRFRELAIRADDQDQ